MTKTHAWPVRWTRAIVDKLVAIIRARMLKWIGLYELYDLQRNYDLQNFYELQRTIVELDDIGELRKVFGWSHSPVLDDDSIYKFESLYDINERRIRDAEVIGTVVRNTNPAVCLDIGTEEGRSAALMSVNAPQSHIYTINIHPDELASGQGGTYTTSAPSLEQIGWYYRSRNLTNITQIISDTAKWVPNIGIIDFAFIDGCHDRDFVYNDTIKALDNVKPGSFILWHDFNPELRNKLPWIYTVCQGIDLLRKHGKINGNIFHVKNSWVGIYKVP